MSAAAATVTVGEIRDVLAALRLAVGLPADHPGRVDALTAKHRCLDRMSRGDAAFDAPAVVTS